MRSIKSRLFIDRDAAYGQAVHALAKAVEAKDKGTGDHAQWLAVLTVQLGEEMHLNERELRNLSYGAILHDIGKICVPDSILKKPAHLSETEWTKIRQHPRIGAEILSAIPQLASVVQIVLYHHERFDGGGYPFGLKGDTIPLDARILSIVDAYCAMVEKRVYKTASSHETAIRELKRCSGTQFDPIVLQSFFQLVDKQTSERKLVVQVCPM